MEKEIIYDKSRSESLIMDYLWNTEEGKKFGEITNYLKEELGKDWKKQTVNTFLNRLIKKGLITTEVSKKSKVYHAAMTEEEYERGKAYYYLDKYYGGSIQEFIFALSGGKQIDEAFANKLLGR